MPAANAFAFDPVRSVLESFEVNQQINQVLLEGLDARPWLRAPKAVWA